MLPSSLFTSSQPSQLFDSSSTISLYKFHSSSLLSGLPSHVSLSLASSLLFPPDLLSWVLLLISYLPARSYSGIQPHKGSLLNNRAMFSQHIWWFSSAQSLSHVRLFVTPWITALQASLSITNSWSSLKLTSIELVMPSSHLILCRPLLLCPQSLPASESFPMSQLFTWGGQSTGVSALPSFIPKKSQGWSPSEWTGWISLQSTPWDGKVSVYNAGDLGLSPGLGRSPGEGNGNPLQYYCLENPMDRGAW